MGTAGVCVCLCVCVCLRVLVCYVYMSVLIVHLCVCVLFDKIAAVISCNFLHVLIPLCTYVCVALCFLQ